MAFPNSHNINIDRSTFYDIQGNYIQRNNYNGTSAPGERGIYELFRASCPDAFHDSQARNPPPRCLEGTRVDVLAEINNWMSHSSEKILWISGPAGTGKSAIAQTVAETCANAGVLGGSFFFFRGAPGRDTAETLIPSMSFQLVTRMPNKRAKIGEMIEADLSILHKPQRKQVENLIIPLFTPTSSDDAQNISSSPYLRIPFFIIDGLDECQGDYIQRDIVEVIGELVNTTSVLRFIIVSRPEPQIEEPFERLAYAVRRMSLGGVERTRQAEDDIGIYLRYGFDKIYRDHKCITEEYWPTGEVISTLVHNSGGAFIYASTVLKYVDDRDFHPVERLDEILHNSPGSTPFTELDLLYRRILGAYKKTDLLLRVLIPIVCGSFLPEVLGTADVEELLQLRRGAAMIILRRMRSIIDVDNLTVYHKSFTDFLHDKERALDYFIDRRKGCAFMAQILLRYISLHANNYYNITEGVLLRYAKSWWMFYCREAGQWDKNPHLLEEISKALDSCQHPQQHLYYVTQPALFLEWFQVVETITVASEYNPLDIQFRLFKKELERWGTIHILTFYEETNLNSLLGYPSAPWRYGDICVRYRPQTGRSAIAADWVCLILCKTRKTSGDIGQYRDIIDPLVKRFVHERWELGSLADHPKSVNFANSHVEVVKKCLEIFSISYQLGQSEPREYSYARKYWTKHLSHVPHGNPDILASLKNFDGSKLRHKFSAEDMQVVQTWLKVWDQRLFNLRLHTENEPRGSSRAPINRR